jgi:hypothetical protein
MGLRPTFAPGSNTVYTITQAAAPLPAPLPVEQHTGHGPACACQHQPAPYAQAAPVVVQAPPRPSIAPYVAGGIGAVTAVAVVGVIAVGLLLAFAVGALSLAVLTAVLRSLLATTSQPDRTRRR